MASKHNKVKTPPEFPMTNRDAANLYSALSAINAVQGNPRFAYAVAINKHKLQVLVNAITEAQTLQGPAKAFGTKRAVIVNQYAEKNPLTGRPLTQGTNLMISDINAFEAEIEALRAAYPEEAKGWDKHNDDVKALLEEDYDATALRRFEFKHLPKSMTPELMTTMLPVLDGEPPEDED